MNLVEFGWFSTHSRFTLPWKINCDAFTDADVESIAKIISWKFAFSDVYGVPRGGCRLAEALKPYCKPVYPLLIVDDVLTTGRSMIEAKDRLDDLNPIGIVIFARGECPNWVWPIFRVNEWAQNEVAT